MATAKATTTNVIVQPIHDCGKASNDIVSWMLLLAGWAFVVGLWVNNIADHGSPSYIFAVCGFSFSVIGCLISGLYRWGNFSLASVCSFIGCVLFIVLHYCKIEESIIYWTHGSVMFAGVVHIYLILLQHIFGIPRLIIRG